MGGKTTVILMAYPRMKPSLRMFQSLSVHVRGKSYNTIVTDRTCFRPNACLGRGVQSHERSETTLGSWSKTTLIYLQDPFPICSNT